MPPNILGEYSIVLGVLRFICKSGKIASNRMVEILFDCCSVNDEIGSI